MFENDIYQNDLFLQILEDVYLIKRVKLFHEKDYDKKMTFFSSKIKKGDIFNMPFNFYYSPDISQNYFLKLKEYSSKNGVNITIKSLKTYKIDNKILFANNPILPLCTSYEKTFANFSKNLKQNINRNKNKCKRHGVKISKINDKSDIEEFYNNILSVQYIDKHKMIFQPLKLYMRLYQENFIDIFVAKNSDKILGGMICIKDGNTLHYNWGATLNYNNIAIGTLLINYAINYAQENSYKYFDFGSTALSDKNLYDFKMRWGATNYKVYQYYTLNKPSTVDLNDSYKFVRLVYSKFPKPFLRWLMPKVVPYVVE